MLKEFDRQVQRCFHLVMCKIWGPLLHAVTNQADNEVVRGCPTCVSYSIEAGPLAQRAISDQSSPYTLGPPACVAPNPSKSMDLPKCLFKYFCSLCLVSGNLFHTPTTPLCETFVPQIPTNFPPLIRQLCSLVPTSGKILRIYSLRSFQNSPCSSRPGNTLVNHLCTLSRLTIFFLDQDGQNTPNVALPSSCTTVT